MLDHINRDALILFPKQALFDWVNSIFTDEKIEAPKLFEHDEANVYLIPKADNIEDALLEIKANFKFFFEKELFHWCIDEEFWPKKLTWEMFEEWFHYSIQSMLVDVLDSAIIKD